ncbi:putative membrane protein [Thermoflexibacter ruber]|uniref:Putative membrane protein n=2 Tax=Thermoflexibacter ruber TaxID=1003 RepID=A0A1I2HIF1_9BACT|nr:putative membrane protein [Thermoflexibacter ruber]
MRHNFEKKNYLCLISIIHIDMKLILKIVVSAVAILITTGLLEDYGVYVKDFITSLKVAVVLGLLNTFIKPIFKLLTFPITLMTFGLSLLVINTIVIMIADHYVADFQISNFIVAFAFGLIVSVVTYVLELIFGLN